LVTALDGKQPLNSNLTTIAGLTATTDNMIVGVASAWASRTPAQVRTTLALVVGTNVQAWDADLDTWAGKTPYAGSVTVTTAKTFNVTNTLTLSGTDGSTLNVGTGGTLGSLALLSTVNNGNWSGTDLSVVNGGTGASSLTGILIGDGTNAVTAVAGTASQVLRRNAGNTAYEFATMAGGGNAQTADPLSQFAQTTSLQLKNTLSDETGSGAAVFNTNPSINNLQGQYTTTATAAGTTTLTVASTAIQRFSGSTTQTCVMPDATTLTAGMQYMIVNNSTGVVTVNKNGGTLIKAVAAGQTLIVTVTDISSSAGTYNSEYSTDLPIGNATASTATFTPAALGSITAGRIEVDAAGVPYYSHTATNRGIVEAPMWARVDADFTLSAASGVQTAFPSSMDVWTLEGSTMYAVEGLYIMTKGTTTTNTTATAQGFVWMDQVASTVVTATATTGGTHIRFTGTISMNAAGTITPQINFSANPGGTNVMKIGSFIKFTKIGTSSFTKSGNVN